MVYGVAPAKAITDSNLAVNARNPDITVGQALGVEIWITFILILVVFAVGDPGRNQNPAKLGSNILIGLVAYSNTLSLPFLHSIR